MSDGDVRRERIKIGARRLAETREGYPVEFTPDLTAMCFALDIASELEMHERLRRKVIAERDKLRCLCRHGACIRCVLTDALGDDK